MITEERLTEALARAHGVRALPVDWRQIDEATVATVPKEIASRHKVCPYRVQGKTLFLLMVDPQDHGAVARIGYSLGFIVRPMIVPEFRMVHLLREHYGVDERWRFDDVQRERAPRAPVPLDRAAATARLDTADTRDDVVESLLSLFHATFRRVLFFIVREPWVVGWSGMGEDVEARLPARLRVPLDQPSAFQTVVRDRSPFVGRLSDEGENERFLRALGKKPTTNAAFLPIVMKGRVVNVVYGDNGNTGNVKIDLGDLLVALQKVPRAYLRIIRRRVAETRKATDAPPIEDAPE